MPVDIDAVYTGNLLMPSSFAFEISDEPMKDYFVVFGPEGPSTLWGLGGHLKLADVGGIISEVATANVEDVNIGSVLASVLPFFNTFNHAVVTGLELEETVRPNNPSGGAIPYDSWTALQEFAGENTLDLNTLLTQSITYNIPDHPLCTRQGSRPNLCG